MADYVLFDVDGVLLSEARCFDVSALVLWELYNSPAWLGLENEVIVPDVQDDRIAELRSRYWLDDCLLDWLKQHGINSNWDMVHAHLVATLALLWHQRLPAAALDNTGYAPNASAATGYAPNASAAVPVIDQKLLQSWGREAAGLIIPDAKAILDWLNQVVPAGAEKNEVFRYIEKGLISSCPGVSAALARAVAELNGPLWELHTGLYQTWYLGDQASGKPGFLSREVPLADPAELRMLLRQLKQQGYIIGIGTGRSLEETKVPLMTFGWWDEFEPGHVATADDAALAAAACGGEPVDKPHPFTYEAAVWGTVPERYKAYVEEPERFRSPEDRVYIIGDSPADVLAARAMNSEIIVPLTGLTGQAARKSFEKMGVTCLIDSVLEVDSALSRIKAAKEV